MTESTLAVSMPDGTASGPTRSSSSWSGCAGSGDPVNRLRWPETCTTSSTLSVPLYTRTSDRRPANWSDVVRITSATSGPYGSPDSESRSPPSGVGDAEPVRAGLRERLLDDRQQLVGAEAVEGVDRDDRVEPAVEDGAQQVAEQLVLLELVALEVAVHEVGVLGLLDDPLDEVGAVLLDRRQLGGVGRPARRGRRRCSRGPAGRPATALPVIWPPTSSGAYAGCTDLPSTPCRSASAVSKEVRPSSSFVRTIARGMLTDAHSCHSAAVAESMPSPAATTNTAASAARRAARSSPTKSGCPGASRRLSTTSPIRNAASCSAELRSRSSFSPRYPATFERTRCSKRVVFPEPLDPTRTTLRMADGSSTRVTGAFVFELMLGKIHGRPVGRGG